MKSRAFFSDIQQQLLSELSMAEESIYLAMAWFTDRVLFHAVLERAGAGVETRILLADDDINRDFGPDFGDLEDCGAEVTWVNVQGGNNIMHNKFCVIDEKTVITGSYNWTHRAHSNHENITVTWDDQQLASMFIGEFERLRQLYAGASLHGLKPFDYNVVSKRLGLIRNHLELNEFEEIKIQAAKLRQYELIPEVEEILRLLDQAYFSDALLAMANLHKHYQSVVSVSAQRVAALRMQIRYLEIEYGSAVEQRDLLGRVIADFRLKVRLALGDLILQLLDLKITWNRMLEKMGKAARLEDLLNQFRVFDEELKRAKVEKKPELNNEDENEIRELYRRGVKLCHPDTTEEAHKGRAEEIFIRLKNAFDQNDLKEMRHIVQSLEAGVWDLGKGNDSISEVERLEAIARDLNFKIERVRKEIDELSGSEDYQEYLQCGNLDEYLQQEEISLKQQIIHFEDRIKQNSHE